MSRSGSARNVSRFSCALGIEFFVAYDLAWSAFPLTTECTVLSGCALIAGIIRVAAMSLAPIKPQRNFCCLVLIFRNGIDLVWPARGLVCFDQRRQISAIHNILCAA